MVREFEFDVAVARIPAKDSIGATAGAVNEYTVLTYCNINYPAFDGGPKWRAEKAEGGHDCESGQEGG